MSFPDIVLETDARSRIAIYTINHADSPLIAQLGNLSHDAFRGGFISGDGCMAVSRDASSIQIGPSSTTSLQWSSPLDMSVELEAARVQIQPIHALPPSMPISLPSNSMQPTCRPISVPQEMHFPVPASQSFNAPMFSKFQAISPYNLPDVLTRMTGQYDFISLCRKLELDKKDFDKISEGIFVRTIDDTKRLYPWGWNTLPTYDHMGIFDRIFVIFQNAVFELKTFKYVDRPGVHPFLFKPEHPGIWFRDGERGPVPGETIILDADVNAVWNRTSPGNAGLIVAGNIAELDYAVFLGHPVQLVWRSDIPQSRIQFAVALNFLAEAKKHGIKVSILKCSGFVQTKEIVELPEIIKQARQYGLDIPSALKDTGCVHISTPQEEFIPGDLPFFWSRGGSTLFFSPGYKAILKKLLNAFYRVSPSTQNEGKFINSNMTGTRSGIFPKKLVGIFYPASAESRTEKLMRKTDFRIPRISSEILKKEDALETVLFQYKIEALFIVYADELAVKELIAVLELCESIRIVTGVFSPVAAENEPAPEDVLKGSTMELVAQYYLVTADGDSVIAKDMDTEITERYTFERDGRVSVSEVKETNTEEAEEEN